MSTGTRPPQSGAFRCKAPLLVVPSLAAAESDGVDGTSLKYLLKLALQMKGEEEKERRKVEEQEKLKTMTEEEEVKDLEQARRELLSLLAVPAPRRTAEQERRVPSLPFGDSCSAQEEEEEDAAQAFLLSFSSCPRSSHSEIWTLFPCPVLGSTVDTFLTSVLLALERPLASGSRSLGVGCY